MLDCCGYVIFMYCFIADQL